MTTYMDYNVVTFYGINANISQSQQYCIMRGNSHTCYSIEIAWRKRQRQIPANGYARHPTPHRIKCARSELHLLSASPLPDCAGLSALGPDVIMKIMHCTGISAAACAHFGGFVRSKGDTHTQQGSAFFELHFYSHSASAEYFVPHRRLTTPRCRA